MTHLEINIWRIVKTHEDLKSTQFNIKYVYIMFTFWKSIVTLSVSKFCIISKPDDNTKILEQKRC